MIDNQYRNNNFAAETVFDYLNMAQSIGFSVITWSDVWFSLKQNEKDDLLDTSDAWTHPKIGNPESKKRTLSLCLSNALSQHKDDVINDIYSSIIKKGFTNPTNLNEYLYIHFWLLENMKGGNISDDHGLYCGIASFYRAINIEKAIHYQTIAYNMIEQCIQEHIDNNSGDRNDGIASFSNTGYILILYLMEAYKFALSVEYEKECISKGYFQPNSRIMLHYLRFDAIREFHKQYGGSILDDLDFLMFDQQFVSEHEGNHIVATHLKYIGNEYYKNDDNENAIKYYQEALSLWPIVSGVKTKMKYATNRLNKSKEYGKTVK